MLRYRAALLLTSLLMTGAVSPAHRRALHRPESLRASDIYSTRALRRVRTVLQLKLLELRKARLERVLRAIERGIPVDDILKTIR